VASRKEIEGTWCLPVFKKYANVLFREAANVGELEAAAAVLRELYSTFQNSYAPPPNSKVMGIYQVLCLLFKIYFRLNSLQNCKHLMRAVTT
jgi:hypothetical protein